MGRLFFIVIIYLFIFSCSKKYTDERIIGYKIIEETENFDNGCFGYLLSANNNKLFLFYTKKPSRSLDIKTNEIKEFGSVGEAPGEYTWINNLMYYRDILYVGNPFKGKLILYDSAYNFLCEKKNYFFKDTKIEIFNDSLILSSNQNGKNAFCIYNINSENEIYEFGSPIEYSDISTNIDENQLLFPEAMTWDSRDTLLIWYDSYNDQVLAYNLLNYNLIRTFGKKHFFSLPPVIEFPGDQYHEKTRVIASHQCAGVSITKDYIFIGLGKFWTLKNWSFSGMSDSEIENVIKNNFYFFDVYSRVDFNYIGTIYPINNAFYKENNIFNLILINEVEDNILGLYFQGQDDWGLFHKIELTIDTSLLL